MTPCVSRCGATSSSRRRTLCHLSSRAEADAVCWFLVDVSRAMALFLRAVASFPAHSGRRFEPEKSSRRGARRWVIPSGGAVACSHVRAGGSTGLDFLVPGQRPKSCHGGLGRQDRAQVLLELDQL